LFIQNHKQRSYFAQTKTAIFADFIQKLNVSKSELLRQCFELQLQTFQNMSEDMGKCVKPRSSEERNSMARNLILGCSAKNVRGAKSTNIYVVSNNIILKKKGLSVPSSCQVWLATLVC
jgi:hypothetical protein